MRPKVVIPILIVFLVVVAILFRYRPNPQKSVSDSAKVPLIQSNQSAGGLKNDNNSAAVQAAPPSTTNQNHMVVDRNNPESIRQYLLAQNVPVEFYGKVVDQDGNALADAEVKGEALHVKVIAPAPWGDQDEIIPIEKRTDSDGRFEVHGMTGRGFGIASILKDGYEVEDLRSGWTTSPGSIGSPVIFKMWSTNIHEQLITGNKSFEIVPDGKPYFIDLTNDEISQTEGGDLKVWIKYPEQAGQGKLYNWSCEIDVINGGLQIGDSYSMFSAPADGYVPTFSLQKQIRDGERGSTGDKKFYVMLNNGKIFGRIQVDLVAPFNMSIPGLIRLSYAINPSGSHILR